MSRHDTSNTEKRKKRLARRAQVLETFFSSTCVLSSEDVREYNALYKTLKSEMPRFSVMQKYRVKQVADSMWLSQRTWRLQAGAIEGARTEALMRLLTPKYGNFLEEDKKIKISIDYLAGSEEEQSKARRIVEKLGITRDMVEAYALELQGPTVMALDKMRARSEQSIDVNEQKLMDSSHSKKLKKNKKVSDGGGQTKRGGAEIE